MSVINNTVVTSDEVKPAPGCWPRLSFILPTLNAEGNLERCLASVVRQTYPRCRYEILVADAHSQDCTREIAAKYGSVVLDDDGMNMEEGKRLALREARGEYVVFIDSDNEFSNRDYVEIAVNALSKNPQALGVEAYYPASPRMNSLCVYLTKLLHISDPICWLMSSDARLKTRVAEIEHWCLPSDSCAYPLGANGFVFRRKDLLAVKADQQFQDATVAVRLMQQGKREWLRITNKGVHHHYVSTLFEFIKKRRRATMHFLGVQAQSASANWMKENPSLPLWAAALYCVTLFGPLWHTIRGLLKDRDHRWLWHIPACLGSVVGDAWGLWSYEWQKADAVKIPTSTLKHDNAERRRNIGWAT